MKRIINFFLFVAVAMFQINTYGQSFVLLGEEYQSGDNSLADIDQKTNIYYSADKTNSGKLYHMPFFVFKSDKNQQLDVRIKEVPLKPDEREVIITLLYSPNSKKQSLVESIKLNEVKNPTNDDLQNITANNLISIPLNYLRIEQIGSSIFKTHENIDGVDLPNSIDLVARLTPDEASILYEQLKKDKVELRFKITYRVNAKFTKSVSTSETSGIYFYKTEAAKDLEGISNAFKWQANYNGSLSKDAAIVTRNQKDNFIGRIQAEVNVFYDIEDKEDLNILEKTWNEYFGKVFKPHLINLEGGTFTSDISRLSSYNFSPSDIQPDKLTDFMNDIKKQFSDESKENIDIAGGAEASYLGFKGKANGSYKKDEFRKSMEDFGWKFEQKGEIFIPKSLEVFIVDKKALKEEGIVNVGIKRSNRKDLIGSLTVKTRVNISEDNYNDFVTKYESLSLNYCPIGTILPYAGDKTQIPNGWNLCDGSYVKINNNEILFKTIGYNWGRNDNGDFRLPNLQGQFLRGVDYERKNDPDVTSRKNGENKIGEVGSYQSDAFQEHQHQFWAYVNCGKDEKRAGAAYGGNGNICFVNTEGITKGGYEKEPELSTETRPKNAYVNYIIRVN